jgi:hypothetical protein
MKHFASAPLFTIPLVFTFAILSSCPSSRAQENGKLQCEIQQPEFWKGGVCLQHAGCPYLETRTMILTT